MGFIFYYIKRGIYILFKTYCNPNVNYLFDGLWDGNIVSNRFAPLFRQKKSKNEMINVV